MTSRESKTMSDEILVQRNGPVTEIVLNRPDHGNAATDDMAKELTRLLRGAGKDFCVGRATMGVAPAGPIEAIERRRSVEVIFDCYGAIRNSPIPVVGIVHGRALGFGCAIAAVCDITIATDAATFQVPEMAHNILPTMVMSAMIDRVPRKAFTYLVYSQATISAESPR